MTGLDGYSTPACFFAAVLVHLPLGLATAVLFPQELIGWGAGAGATGAASVGLLMAEIARRKGRAAQKELYSRLGGKPSTILLRHRDDRIDPHTKARYHACLARTVPNVVMPTAQDEAENPEAADVVYASCVNHLLEATRNRKRFSLVFNELVTYGMIRNLRGMKPLAITFAATGTLICAVRAMWDGQNHVYAPAAVAAIISASLFTVWIVRLNDQWMEEAAFDYARALLASCEKLPALFANDINPESPRA